MRISHCDLATPWLEFILIAVVSSMERETRPALAIIYYHPIRDRANIVEPRKKTWRVPINTRTSPLFVRPNRFVPVNKGVQLWHCFLSDKMLYFEAVSLIK